MISQTDRTERTDAAPTPPEAPPPGAQSPPGSVGNAEQNTVVDLGRIAWLGTVVVCLVVVTVLVLEGYFGYAAVTLAVAIAAFINLV